MAISAQGQSVKVVKPGTMPSRVPSRFCLRPTTAVLRVTIGTWLKITLQFFLKAKLLC